MTLLWILGAFLAGAIPFSVLMGRFLLKADIRNYGDGNPGATNILRASGSKPLFVLAFLLDAFKGTIPVGLAYFAAGYTGLDMLLIAIAPILGHAFSPFLGFKGGKAVAVTFGVWIGLTIWEVPTVLGIMLGYWFLSVKNSGWAVMLALFSLLIYLLFAHNDPLLINVWIANTMILAYKHREDLMQTPGIRRWLPFLDGHAEASS